MVLIAFLLLVSEDPNFKCFEIIELQVNWDDNPGGGGELKPARFSFSEF